MEIRALDTYDTAQVAAWHSVLHDGYTSGRPPVWWSGLEAETHRFAHPAPYHERHVLVGVEHGELVCATDVVLPLRENQHTASVELAVRPDARGAGHGRALAGAVRRLLADRGRTLVEAEVYALPGEPFEESRSGRFALAQGLRPGNVETRYLLDLRAHTAPPAPAVADDTEVVGWIGSTPPAYVDELLILHRQMEQDVPRGELSREPLDLDLERLRTSQQRLADTGWTSVTSLVLVGGEAAGYTEVLVHRDDEVMVQEDTLVLPAHRGRRFGQLLKTANLQRLEPVREGRTLLQTFTADSNTAMRATNTKFGFEPADVLYECEGDVSA